MFDAKGECSQGFVQSWTPLFVRFARQRRGGARAAELHLDLTADNVPQRLPDDLAEPHLRRFSGIAPLLLRRYASVRIIQMITGGPLGDAATRLGWTTVVHSNRGPGRVWNAGTTVRFWSRQLDDPAELDNAITSIAYDLEQRPKVNYQRRRDILSSWRLSVTEWTDTINDHELDAEFEAEIHDDFHRLYASGLVWGATTSTERILVPRGLRPIERDWRTRQYRQPAWVRLRRGRSQRIQKFLTAINMIASLLADQIDDDSSAEQQHPGTRGHR